MFLTNVVTAVCLGLLVAWLIAVVVNFLLTINNREKRIEYIRSFKSVKGLFVYFIAVILYFIGFLYEGKDFGFAFFQAISNLVELIVLNYNISSIEALILANVFYRYTLYFCFVLIAINAILFSLSIFSQYVWVFLQNSRLKYTKKDKLIIFGNNANSRCVYDSDDKRVKVLVDKISSEDASYLYLNKYVYANVKDFEVAVKKEITPILKRKTGCYTVIVNTQADDDNILICKSIINFIDEHIELQEMLFERLKVCVFGEPKYEAIYEDIVASSHGCVEYVNKYQKIAVNFIDKYPLTKFMTEKQIDYKSALIKKNVEINMLMIGFGKTNQQIFLTSVANNQFITGGKGEPKLKKVNYYLFDKNPAEKNKNLNHNYYRYQKECRGLNGEEYLPLPEEPANEIFCHLDVNDCDFYNKIRKICTRNANDVNYVVIAFGTDLENIDMAHKLLAKCREWEISNFAIFVKVRTNYKELTIFEEANCFCIGNEMEEVYNLNNILNDKTFRMSQMRNETYSLEYEITSNPNVAITEEFVEENHLKTIKKWYITNTQLERESNVYACLSIRSKLNMLGLDYVEEGCDGERVSEEEYFNKYAINDMPDTATYNKTVNGKDIIYYSAEFKPSTRTNLAVHEHLRWNSFMISKGVIPATKEQILKEYYIDKQGKKRYTNGKSYALRRHGNLTTMAGLMEYRKMIAERDGKTEESCDVIKYDYQLLDDAYWLLTQNGYKIIKK